LSNVRETAGRKKKKRLGGRGKKKRPVGCCAIKSCESTGSCVPPERGMGHLERVKGKSPVLSTPVGGRGGEKIRATKGRGVCTGRISNLAPENEGYL